MRLNTNFCELCGQQESVTACRPNTDQLPEETCWVSKEEEVEVVEPALLLLLLFSLPQLLIIEPKPNNSSSYWNNQQTENQLTAEKPEKCRCQGAFSQIRGDVGGVSCSLTDSQSTWRCWIIMTNVNSCVIENLIKKKTVRQTSTTTPMAHFFTNTQPIRTITLQRKQTADLIDSLLILCEWWMNSGTMPTCLILLWFTPLTGLVSIAAAAEDSFDGHIYRRHEQNWWKYRSIIAETSEEVNVSLVSVF